MKTILAGLALEGGDDPIVARAVQLAGRHKSKLILVHVIENAAFDGVDMPGAPDASAISAMLESEAADRLGRIVASLDTDIAPETVIIKGKPFEVISELVRQRKADLVVIGPGRARNMREKVFGSTADRIVRSSSVPVLVVRPGPTEPYRRVVVAADLSLQSLSASRAARALAPEAAIEHIHVVDMPLTFEQALLRAGTSKAEIDRIRQARLVAARERLKAAFAGIVGSASLRLRLFHGEARKVLVRQARNPRTDLIALGTHGRSAVSQMLLGSVARNVLQAATRDVLVV
ncbi:MAG: universal stress protein [Pseudaminobacter sp.]